MYRTTILKSLLVGLYTVINMGFPYKILDSILRKKLTFGGFSSTMDEMRACCGQQDVGIRIGLFGDASLARSFSPCPVASLCQSAPCIFLAADQRCMIGKTSRILKCTVRSLEISSWSKIRKIQRNIKPPNVNWRYFFYF